MIPISPHKTFKPKYMIVALDDALELCDEAELKSWIQKRITKGDPGPLHVDASVGEFWTDQSKAEGDTP